MSSSGLCPERRIRLRARSTIFTGSPMSRTKISPPFAYAPACSTRETASGMVMKYLMMSGCVTVTGPPASICFWKSGITLPLLPSTFPKRTATNSVLECRLYVWIIISQTRFVAPMMFVGLTALSVDIMTNRRTFHLSAACTTFQVPRTLFFTASFGLSSISGTCLCAAAW